MAIECNSFEYDHRLQCYAVNARTTYGWYYGATIGAESNLAIQRDIIKGRKTYETLRADLKRGCILPPIVLSVDIDLPPALSHPPATPYFYSNADDLRELETLLTDAPNQNVKIIDGLQRTNAIRSVMFETGGEDAHEFAQRPIRLEIWLNISFYSLAYRMLLLNAGQKPMSMKHQIEVLADSMRESLASIGELEIIRGIDHRRRVRPGQFQLSTMAGAFQAWIQRQPNIDLRNAITEQLLAEEAIATLGHGLDPAKHADGVGFADFVKWLVAFDIKLGQENIRFLSNETVVHAIAAAFANSYSNDEMKRRAKAAMERILEDADRLGVEQSFQPHMFETIRTQIDPKKSNVGDATRELVYRAVSEYIISGGSKSMMDCWTFASTFV